MIARKGIWAAACLACLAAGEAPAGSSYQLNFEQTPLGKPPEDLMILNGVFTVKKEAANAFLELTADPLDGDGFLFGPGGNVEGTVSARIQAYRTGRRFPEFGVGSNDAGGYKLIMIPATGTVEIRKGDDPLISAPISWTSGAWERFELTVSKSGDGKLVVAGTVWPDGSAKPGAATVTLQDAPAPSPGRASAWGMPYSGTPIRFDDLGFSTAKP